MTDETKPPAAATDSAVRPAGENVAADQPATGIVAEATAAAPGSAIPADELARLTDEIVTALKTVYDPEIPADIYELGLIYNVDVDDDRAVKIKMTLTTPNCPGGGGFAGRGRERGRERAGRARGQSRYRLGSALGSEPHVGRGARGTQHVVRDGPRVARRWRAHYIEEVRLLSVSS